LIVEAAMIARRGFVAAIAALALTGPAAAQSYPSRPIKLVLPFTAGSPNDVMARLLAQHLAPRLGQPLVVENKPGGGTAIGTKAAASAEPDGYTLLFISSALVIDPAMKRVAYDPLKEFAPVATVNTTAWLITVSPTLPAKTMAEFVAFTKAHHGTVNFAATLPDFLGGRIQVLNPTPSTSLPLIRDGKMRALLITSPERSVLLPDVPTARELGLPDLTLEFWAGVLAPAGTPPQIVGRLNAAINDTLRSPEMKEAMTKLGMDAKIGSPQNYARFIAEESPRWNAVAQSTGVKID
jgi:tripartite-type tricarboxylate transporter receptor subunit TctC